FDMKALSLNQIEQGVAKSDDVFGQIRPLMALTSKESLRLGGTADIAGVLKTSQGGHQLDMTVDLHKAQLGLNDKSVAVGQMDGHIDVATKKIKISHLHGTIGSGTFDLDGSADIGGEPSFNLTLTAKDLDLAQLSSVLKLFRVQFPVLSEQHLY